MRAFFGNLPTDAQMMLTRHLRIDFSNCSFKAPRWFSAWAINDKDFIVGIFAAEFQLDFEAKVTALVLDPRCVSRRVLRAFFTALFSKAKRLTAEIEPDNIRSLRQVQRLGFYYEGYRPLGLEGSRDTIVFGMLKEECRYLKGYDEDNVIEGRHNGQSAFSPGPLSNHFGAERPERFRQPVQSIFWQRQ